MLEFDLRRQDAQCFGDATHYYMKRLKINGIFMDFESSRCRRFSVKVKEHSLYRVDSNYALERRS